MNSSPRVECRINTSCDILTKPGVQKGRKNVIL